MLYVSMSNVISHFSFIILAEGCNFSGFQLQCPLPTII